MLDACVVRVCWGREEETLSLGLRHCPGLARSVAPPSVPVVFGPVQPGSEFFGVVSLVSTWLRRFLRNIVENACTP